MPQRSLSLHLTSAALQKLTVPHSVAPRNLGPKLRGIRSGDHGRENGRRRAGAVADFDPPIFVGRGKAAAYLAYQSAGIAIRYLVAFELEPFLVEHGVVGPQEMEVISGH
jgi:hypothetical protein